jgi:hypothetical protein
MENAIENKILARVKKMLALGNDAAATEAERETALRMAYNLLAKHNLEVSDVPGDANNEAREEQSFTMCGDVYIRNICHSMAELFFCGYFFIRQGAGKDSHHFIGRQSNVVTARYMAEYIVKSVRKEAAKRFRTATTPEGRSFGVGATRSIAQRVRELKAADVEKADIPETATATNDVPLKMVGGVPGSALALAKFEEAETKANDAFYATIYSKPVKETKERASTIQSGAYREGKEFGNKVNLSQQVGTTAAPKRTAIK